MGLPQAMPSIPDNYSDFNKLDGLVRKFRYEQCRWAVMRTENVDTILSKFRTEPNSVFVISDPKLAGNELVMLKKERFESLVKVFRDLMSGQAAIHHNVEALTLAASFLNDYVEKDAKLLEDNGVKKAVKLIRAMTAQLSSNVLIKRPTQSMETADLTEEEKELLR